MQTIPAMTALLAAHAFHDDTIPIFERITATQIPPTWTKLLCGTSSMTIALSKCYGEEVKLTLLGDDLLVPEKLIDRAVVLSGRQTEKPFALAGLRIHLERFPPHVRVRFVEAVTPFGKILKEEGISFTSEPACFFQALSNTLLSRELKITEGQTLFGRMNDIKSSERIQLAEVVEILVEPRCIE
jgi:chorismate-pyruvate lyase